MDRRRYLEAVAVAASTAILAGCTGGNGDDGASPTTTPTATDGEATATATADDDGSSTVTETETAAATRTEEPPDDPEQRVLVGDTVLWEWVGGGHNIKYDEGDVPEDTTWEGTSGSRTTTYGEGHVHWHTFEAAGEYDYYCVPHRSSGMRGSFTVSE